MPLQVICLFFLSIEISIIRIFISLPFIFFSSSVCKCLEQMIHYLWTQGYKILAQRSGKTKGEPRRRILVIINLATRILVNKHLVIKIWLIKFGK